MAMQGLIGALAYQSLFCLQHTNSDANDIALDSFEGICFVDCSFSFSRCAVEPCSRPVHFTKGNMSKDAEEAKKFRAEKAKNEGNKAFRGKNYEKALQKYNIAIKLDPEKVVLVFLYSSVTCILKQTNKLCPRHKRQINANINIATSITTRLCL